ncbi:hypothetical protein [Paractinoplanes toevensis]|uniref:Uncharacterized protein n=1 Tax=Paractinoplanes toevensis TaxID=571911 RepID=A0A919TA51_9ACTN|nr:hypothetical protein [Actinoplanes toevensis]GIM90961.1 hypothetical protein Ato02nite_027540 [Actinoplanes toevensis]
MTTPQNPLVPAALAADLTSDDDETRAGTPVGAADAEADAARSGADADPAHGARDTDGVPVGEADHEADKRASGA